MLATVALLTVARSAVFVFWEGAHFDANQAVIGLMAKHLAELRAFPLFMYGQSYQLAVESWLAAPVFVVAGASVTALKLPLLAINVVVACLLVWLLVKDVGLGPARAGLAAMFFVLPGPGTVSKLLEASGGTLEPFLYVLLLWIARRRPIWAGLVLGIGVLHREFTIYGLAALLMLWMARGSLFSRETLRRLGVMLAIAGVVWLTVQAARPYSSAAGPGTSPSDLAPRARGSVELANRLCIDWRAVPGGFADIVGVHWPYLFATREIALRRFVIESDVRQGMRGAGLLLGGAMLLAAAGVIVRLFRERRWPSDYDFCAYLVLVAALSVTGYVVTRCGVVEFAKIRYDMLSILGAVGVAAWYLRTEASRARAIAWTLLLLASVAITAAAHGRLAREYLHDAPVGGKRLLTAALEARGIRYGLAPYANAYPVTFLSNERIIIASSTRVRIRPYRDQVRAHRSEAVTISRRPCAAGRGDRLMRGLYACPL